MAQFSLEARNSEFFKGDGWKSEHLAKPLMLVSFTQKQFGTQYGTLKVRHQFATWCATSLQFRFNAFQVTSISQIFASVFLASLLHRVRVLRVANPNVQIKKSYRNSAALAKLQTGGAL